MNWGRVFRFMTQRRQMPVAWSLGFGLICFFMGAWFL